MTDTQSQWIDAAKEQVDTPALLIDLDILERNIAGMAALAANTGIRLRPHAWISSEWFSPANTPGIAIPFYLAHPRLVG